VEVVITLDQAPHLGSLPGAELPGRRPADQGEQVAGRRDHQDRRVPDRAEPGPAVSQDDHPAGLRRLAALGQEPLQVVGRLGRGMRRFSVQPLTASFSQAHQRCRARARSRLTRMACTRARYRTSSSWYTDSVRFSAATRRRDASSHVAWMVGELNHVHGADHPVRSASFSDYVPGAAGLSRCRGGPARARGTCDGGGREFPSPAVRRLPLEGTGDQRGHLGRAGGRRLCRRPGRDGREHERADAIWLARHGWTVTAVDVSAVALDRAAAVRPGGTLLLVGHHPDDLRADAALAARADMFRSAEDIATSLDPGEWEITVADDIGRSATDPDGQPATIRDTVLRAVRRR
jgi:hypothetical protein